MVAPYLRTAALSQGAGVWKSTLAALKAFLAGNAGANNPHSLPAMASPPTVTTSTSGLLGTYTNAKSFTAQATVDSFFRIEGGRQLLSATVFEKPYVANKNGSAKVFVATRISFNVNADLVAFYVMGSALPYRFLVDDQYVDKTGTVAAVTSGTGDNWIILTFGSKTTRKITIELQQDQAVRYVALKAADSWGSRPAAKQMRGIVLGDSLTASASATHFGDGYALVAGDYLGLELWPSGVGGTGYVASNSGVDYALPERLSVDLDSALIYGDVHVVVVAMGRNDIDLPATDVTSVAAACYSAIRAKCPGAVVFVLGPWDVLAPGASGAEYDATRAEIIAAMGARGGFYFLDNKAVAYTKQGADPIHYDTAGGATLGVWLDGAIRSLVAA